MNEYCSCNFLTNHDPTVAQFDLGDLNNLNLESTPEEEPGDNTKKELHFNARSSANFGDEPQSKLQAFHEEE
jgi:hypothetical protein